MNEPRQIPFDFCVVLWHEVIYLVDRSEVTHPYSTLAHYLCEPLYLEDDDGESEILYPQHMVFHDSIYILESDIDDDELISLEMDSEDISPNLDRDEAWDMAREEAHANRRI